MTTGMIISFLSSPALLDIMASLADEPADVARSCMTCVSRWRISLAFFADWKTRHMQIRKYWRWVRMYWSGAPDRDTLFYRSREEFYLRILGHEPPDLFGSWRPTWWPAVIPRLHHLPALPVLIINDNGEDPKLILVNFSRASHRLGGREDNFPYFEPYDDFADVTRCPKDTPLRPFRPHPWMVYPDVYAWRGIER